MINDPDYKGSGNNSLKTRRIIFIVISIVFVCAFILLSTPLFSISRIAVQDSLIPPDSNIVPINGALDLIPEISHYLVVDISASNDSSIDYPAGTAAIKWNTETGEDTATYQQNFKIYIDGKSHSYYVPVGENKYWTGTGKGTEEDTVPGSGNILDLVLEIPQVGGVEIEVERILLKERIAFPADIYISKKLQDLISDNTRTISPLLIPAYLLILMFLILAAVFYFMFRSPFSKQGRNTGIIIRKTVFIFILAVLLSFSAKYIYTEIITAKSYWDSYRSYVLSGRLDRTYMGFYDFEKFIQWLDGLIPPEEDLIVFVRGEPVYIMSEMAYNLYPRDIKFINISNRSYDDINSEIGSLSKVRNNSYNHIVVLSEDDAGPAFRFELISRYRVTGGFVYRID
ncbi:MAG: hypothetical protein MUO59_00135 [Actinobacteria bacterium]|nr:hypothetical protein [Actinomycetota bacterium]